jgi:hypothetical protein
VFFSEFVPLNNLTDSNGAVALGALELFNAGITPVSLSMYQLRMCSTNCSTWSTVITFPVSATVNPADVYVVCTASFQDSPCNYRINDFSISSVALTRNASIGFDVLDQVDSIYSSNPACVQPTSRIVRSPLVYMGNAGSWTKSVQPAQCEWLIVSPSQQSTLGVHFVSAHVQSVSVSTRMVEDADPVTVDPSPCTLSPLAKIVDDDNSTFVTNNCLDQRYRFNFNLVETARIREVSFVATRVREEVKFPAKAVQIFSYTGFDQYYTVPDGVSYLRVKVWGAGGAGGSGLGYEGGSGGMGGSGGFSSGLISVQPGQVYAIAVGGGGVPCNRSTSYPTNPPAASTTLRLGPYGFAGSAFYGAGTGGGLSGVFNQTISFANAVLIAGGGGGGNDGPWWCHGGQGGGSNGGTASNSNVNRGASQSSGGQGHGDCSISNCGAGTQLYGGSATWGNVNQGGGAGGGGYYGGGAGYSRGHEYCGGGGSGYAKPNLVRDAILAGGASVWTMRPPYQEDVWYQPGIGVGGTSTGFYGNQIAGGNGLVVVEPMGRWNFHTVRSKLIAAAQVIFTFFLS